MGKQDTTKQLTIRGVTRELGRRLEQLSEAREKSVNATVLDLLSEAVGLDDRRARFRRYGTWSAAEQADFEAAVRSQRTVDDALWK